MVEGVGVQVSDHRPAALWFRAGGQERLAHQVSIDRARTFASFPDGPYHQRLPAPRITRREHSRDARLVVVAGDIAPLIHLQTQLGNDAVGFGTEKSKGEQDQIAFQVELASRNLLHHHASIVALPIEAYSVQLFDYAVVAGKVLGIDTPVAYDPFFMRS